jgi:hypothetical protein
MSRSGRTVPSDLLGPEFRTYMKAGETGGRTISRAVAQTAVSHPRALSRAITPGQSDQDKLSTCNRSRLAYGRIDRSRHHGRDSGIYLLEL